MSMSPSDEQLIIEERDAAVRNAEYVETERNYWIQKCSERDETIAKLMREIETLKAEPSYLEQEMNNADFRRVYAEESVKCDMEDLRENIIATQMKLGDAVTALIEARINFWAGATVDGSITEAVFDDFVTGHNAKIDAVLKTLSEFDPKLVPAQKTRFDGITMEVIDGALVIGGARKITVYAGCDNVIESDTVKIIERDENGKGIAFLMTNPKSNK